MSDHAYWLTFISDLVSFLGDLDSKCVVLIILGAICIVSFAAKHIFSRISEIFIVLIITPILALMIVFNFLLRRAGKETLHDLPNYILPWGKRKRNKEDRLSKDLMHPFQVLRSGKRDKDKNKRA